jgi:hypothetical protein
MEMRIGIATLENSEDKCIELEDITAYDYEDVSAPRINAKLTKNIRKSRNKK